MKSLFEMYEKEKLLDPHERKILIAALDLSEKTAKDVMTPLEKAYLIDINVTVTKDLLREIYSHGFSRIPIYEGKKDNIVGILMSRDLILINPEKTQVTVKQLSSILVRNFI
jgi:metal transporter CNNM